jgi:hypothetical protein
MFRLATVTDWGGSVYEGRVVVVLIVVGACACACVDREGNRRRQMT